MLYNTFLDENEEYLDKERLKREGIFVDADDQPNELDKHYMPPLPRSVLRRIRKRIILDQRTREILIEIVMYFSFVAIELLVVLGHTDATQAFHVTKGVHDVFVEAAYGDDGVPFYDVRLLCVCTRVCRFVFVSRHPRERDVAQSIACPPLKRSVVGSILLSGPSCSLGYFPFQPVAHNWFIKGRGMYCSVYGKVHIKDPLLLIEKSSLCGGSGFPSKKCVNVTI